MINAVVRQLRRMVGHPVPVTHPELEAHAEAHDATLRRADRLLLLVASYRRADQLRPSTRRVHR